LFLDKYEEKMYNGEYGWAFQVSMRILTRLGDLFGADRLITITSSHLSGISYKTLGDAPIDFLEAIVEANGKVMVPTTTNPCGIDRQYVAAKLPEAYVKKQRYILDLYAKMGVKKTLTCTPYYLKKPISNSHLAWAESSAVIYANSVLNAWTNREGGPSALAAALVGKTPNYGLHKPENRQPHILVNLETKIENETEIGALGIYLGKQIREKIPAFKNLSINTTKEELKQLGAALASSGMTNLFYMDTTPEAKKHGLETISIEDRDIKTTIESLSANNEKSPDLVFIGCPHCSAKEIAKVAKALEKRKIIKGKELWICTSHHIKEKSKQNIQIIESAGGKVICDTCAVVTWLKDLNINNVMTNSAKTAYYLPLLNKVEATLAPLNHCIKTVTKPQ
jgi:predicted aconitase